MNKQETIEQRIERLETEAIAKMASNSTRSSGMTNKTILFELLTSGEYKREQAPVKAATLYFTKVNKVPTTQEYMDKIKSIKNSLDTMVSDYNFEDKVKGDKILSGTTLNDTVTGLSITK